MIHVVVSLLSNPFPSPGDLPNPGIKPGSPALQADASPSEPPGKLFIIPHRPYYRGGEGVKELTPATPCATYKSVMMKSVKITRKAN